LKSYVFKVVVEPDEFEDGRKAFTAHCPELPGALTWGATEAEALEKIKEAIQLVLEELQGAGKPIPPAAILTETESPAVVVSV
jgi:predicted RNase H-like HicB family nuclease